MSQIQNLWIYSFIFGHILDQIKTTIRLEMTHVIFFHSCKFLSPLFYLKYHDSKYWPNFNNFFEFSCQKLAVDENLLPFVEKIRLKSIFFSIFCMDGASKKP